MKVKGVLLVLGMLFLSLSLSAQSAEDLISQGDALYEQMADMETAQKAKSLYLQASGMMENRYEAMWRMARILYFIGEHTEKKKEKKAIFSQGVYYAEKAINLEPEKPDGHYWLGVNNGKYGETRGVLKSLFLVKPIKNSMNKVIELDRSYEDGGPDRVLGRVYFKLPGFAGGSKQKSLEHLLKSKEYGPEDPLTRVYLAETYLSLDRIDEARQELEFVLNMESDPRWIAGVEEAKADARELLKHKKFRKK